MRLEPFTVIGPSTRYGMLTPPSRARFGLWQRLVYYPTDDLEKIVRRSAGILDISFEPDGGHEIAKRSRGTPRVANRLLRRVRDYAQVRADGVVTGPVAMEALARLNEIGRASWRERVEISVVGGSL